MLWSRLDQRVEADDMFVALEETNGHLFWCTNYGYFGFIPLSEPPASDDTCLSPEPTELFQVEGLTDLVSYPLGFYAQP